ncbi:MAG: N-formylglutamate deformylase [Alphaproteobacteria bacterium]
MEPYRFTAGETPLLVSIPHCGTHLPADIATRMTDAGRLVADADWHVDRLYDFAGDLGAGVLAATHARYVVDLNRPPDDAPLYPGADNTGLCPTTTFAREPIYKAGVEPDADEIARRLATYWRPYHVKLAAEIARLKARHGVALLFEAHSIRSEVPRFFAGRLPDLNLGTAGGASIDPRLAERLAELCGRADGLTSVLNGRFKGGYITRAYGEPAKNVHAVQLEQAQITYMLEDPPFTYLPERAAGVRPLLRSLLEEMLDWATIHQPN